MVVCKKNLLYVINHISREREREREREEREVQSTFGLENPEIVWKALTAPLLKIGTKSPRHP